MSIALQAPGYIRAISPYIPGKQRIEQSAAAIVVAAH